MFMIDYYDDDRNVDLSIGPYAEKPTAAQALAAIRAAVTDGHGSDRYGYNWVVYDIGEVKPMPVPSKADIELAESEGPDASSGYTDFD